MQKSKIDLVFFLSERKVNEAPGGTLIFNENPGLHCDLLNKK